MITVSFPPSFARARRRRAGSLRERAPASERRARSRCTTSTSWTNALAGVHVVERAEQLTDDTIDVRVRQIEFGARLVETAVEHVGLAGWHQPANRLDVLGPECETSAFRLVVRTNRVAHPANDRRDMLHDHKGVPDRVQRLCRVLIRESSAIEARRWMRVIAG